MTDKPMSSEELAEWVGQIASGGLVLALGNFMTTDTQTRLNSIARRLRESGRVAGDYDSLYNFAASKLGHNALRDWKADRAFRLTAPAASPMCLSGGQRVADCNLPGCATDGCAARVAAEACPACAGDGDGGCCARCGGTGKVTPTRVAASPDAGPTAPCNITEYDGAFKCWTHNKAWGAITDADPNPCRVEPTAPVAAQGERGLPFRDPTKRDTEQGLFHKFEVSRTDGSSEPGGKHHGCAYFVLDIQHDPCAKPALAAYADAVEPTHPLLAADMRRIYALRQPAQPEGAVAWQLVPPTPRYLRMYGTPVTTDKERVEAARELGFSIVPLYTRPGAGSVTEEYNRGWADAMAQNNAPDQAAKGE